MADINVRLGEWDTRNTNEPLPDREFGVSRIFIHPAFNILNSKNNIAIVRLSSNVNLGEFPTIGTGCLPCEKIGISTGSLFNGYFSKLRQFLGFVAGLLVSRPKNFNFLSNN